MPEAADANIQEIFGFSKAEKDEKELRRLSDLHDSPEAAERWGSLHSVAKKFLDKDPSLSPRDAIKLARQDRDDQAQRAVDDVGGVDYDKFFDAAYARQGEHEDAKKRADDEEWERDYAKKRADAKKKKSSDDQWTGPGSMHGGSHTGAWDNYDSRDSKLGRH
jgi:hypothetical protein